MNILLVDRAAHKLHLRDQAAGWGGAKTLCGARAVQNPTTAEQRWDVCGKCEREHRK
jgi:hypothetical protein